MELFPVFQVSIESHTYSFYSKAAITPEWSLHYFYRKSALIFLLLLNIFFSYKQMLQLNRAACEQSTEGEV